MADDNLKLKITVDGKQGKKEIKQFMRDYREQAALAKTITTQLGRELDGLINEFGHGSPQVQKFVDAQLKNNKVAVLQKKALGNLQNALKAGAISGTAFANSQKKMASNAELFTNKMQMGTPIRSIQKNLMNLSGVFSMINPQLGMFASQFGHLADIINGTSFDIGGPGLRIPGLGDAGKEANIFQQIIAQTRLTLTTLNPVVVAGGAALGTLAAGSISAGLEAKKTIPVFAEFERSLNRLAALANLNKEEQAALGNEIEALAARTPDFDAGELAKSMIELQKAGVGGSAALKLLEENIEAAIGTQQSLTDTNTQSLSALKSLGLETQDAAKINNMFAAVANNSLSVFADYSEVIAGIGPQVKALQQPHAEVVASIGLLKDNGIETSTVMTNLRQIYSTLLKPTSDGAAMFKKYGVELVTASGKARPLSEVLKTLKTNLSDLSGPAQAQVIAKMFEKRSVAAVLSLMNGVDTKLKDLTETAEQASTNNTIGKMAVKMRKGFANAEIALKSFESTVDTTVGRNIITKFSGLENSTRATTAVLTELSRSGRFAEMGQNIGAIIRPFTDLRPVLAESGALFKIFFIQATAFFSPLASLITQILGGALGAINNLLSVVVAILQPVIDLTNAATSAINTTAAWEIVLTSLGAAMLAMRFGPVVAGLALIGGALLAIAPDVETLTDTIETGMSNNVQAVMNGSKDMTSILTAFKEDTALTVHEVVSLWNSGLLSWWEKSALVLKGLTADFQATFGFIESAVKRFWLSTIGASQGGIASLASGISEAVGGNKTLDAVGGRFKRLQEETEAQMSLLKQKQDSLLAKSFNKTLRLGVKDGLDASGQRLASSSDGKGLGVDDDDQANKKKERAREKAARAEAAKNRRKERIQEAQIQADLAAMELETAEQLTAEKEELRAIEQEIFLKREKQAKKNLEIDQAKHELGLQKNLIKNMAAMGQMTETQEVLALNSLEAKEIELAYDQELHEIGLLKLDLEAKQTKLKAIKIQQQSKESEVVQKLLRSQEQLTNADQAIVNAPTAKEADRLKAEKLKLQKTVDDLKTTLINLQNASTANIAKAEQAISSAKNKVENTTKSAKQEKDQALEALSVQQQADLDKIAFNNAEKMQTSLTNGSKTIFNKITSAFDDGKLSIQEGFEIAQTILDQFSKIFSNDNGTQGLGALLGSFSGGGFAGPASSNFDSATLTRGSDGVFTAFNKLTGVTESLGTSCGIAAKEAVGLGQEHKGLAGAFSGMVKGISGMFSGGGIEGVGGALGGIGGMFGSVASMAGPVLGIGSSFISGFISRRKKKKEEQEKRIIDEINFMVERAFNSIDDMQKQVENRLEIFRDNLEEISREISRIDVNTSLFLGQEVINRTREQIQMTIDTIGEGNKLLVKARTRTIAHQGMVIKSISQISGLNAKSTGLYAERDKQLKALLKTRAELSRRLHNEGASSGAVEKAILQQIDAVSRRMVEINDSFNDQIKDLENQRKDLDEELSRAVDQQKQNFITMKNRVDKAIAEFQFGDIGATLSDTLVETLEEIREVMISGIDPEQASFLIAKIKADAMMDFEEEFRQFNDSATDSYLESIRDIQDDLLSLVGEGRATGPRKISRSSREAEIQRRLEALRSGQVGGDNVDPRAFGLSLTESTDAVQAFTDMLNEGVKAIANQTTAGQFRAIDAIGPINVTDPKVLASMIRKELERAGQTNAIAAIPAL